MYRIDNYIARKYGFVRNDIFTLTYHPGIRYHKLFTVLKHVIDRSDLSKQAKFLLKLKCKAVIKRERTIGEMLINNKSATDIFSPWEALNVCATRKNMCYVEWKNIRIVQLQQ